MIDDVTPTAGVPTQMTVTAVNGETQDATGLTYQWSDDCGPSALFAAPNALATSWTDSEAEFCTVKIDVSAGGMTRSRSQPMTVFGGSDGAIQVSGSYIPNHYVQLNNTSVTYWDATTSLIPISMAPGATTDPSWATHAYTQFFTDAGTATVTDSDDCGGTWNSFAPCTRGGGACTPWYSWTAPATGAPRLCRLTFHANLILPEGTMSDSWTVGVVVQ